MIETTTSYATDEDLALRASADFLLLCPRDQKLASGNDGVFQKDDPWTLNSASVDFQANGLSPGKIVLLTQPTSSFKPPGESFVVQAVSPGAVLLRRKGQLPGMGQGPSGPNGLTGVEFFSTTLGPQIELASYDLNKRYGIDDFIAGRRSCDLFDTRIRGAGRPVCHQGSTLQGGAFRFVGQNGHSLELETRNTDLFPINHKNGHSDESINEH